jgi:hypothetical protein
MTDPEALVKRIHFKLLKGFRAVLERAEHPEHEDDLIAIHRKDGTDTHFAFQIDRLADSAQLIEYLYNEAGELTGAEYFPGHLFDLRRRDVAVKMAAAVCAKLAALTPKEPTNA